MEAGKAFLFIAHINCYFHWQVLKLENISKNIHSCDEVNIYFCSNVENYMEKKVCLHIVIWIHLTDIWKILAETYITLKNNVMEPYIPDLFYQNRTRDNTFRIPRLVSIRLTKYNNKEWKRNKILSSNNEMLLRLFCCVKIMHFFLPLRADQGTRTTGRCLKEGNLFLPVTSFTQKNFE